MAYILECRHIDKTYQTGKLEVPVLHDVNFAMEAGEYVAIMGPSGSGKSTLMNIIGCLDRLTEGELLLDGEPVSQLSEKELALLRLRKVGFVFQTFQLLESETALGNVELPLTYAKVPRKERRAIAAEALEKVGLGDRLEFKPSQLSGGQKQRVAIARAVVNHPKILLADEPTGALDSKSGQQVMELFRALNQEGVSVLMITHNREIASYADRVVEIRDGVLLDGWRPTTPLPIPSVQPEDAVAAATAAATAAAAAVAAAAAERPASVSPSSPILSAPGIQVEEPGDGFFDDVDEEPTEDLSEGFFDELDEEEDRDAAAIIDREDADKKAVGTLRAKGDGEAEKVATLLDKGDSEEEAVTAKMNGEAKSTSAEAFDTDKTPATGIPAGGSEEVDT